MNTTTEKFLGVVVVAILLFFAWTAILIGATAVVVITLKFLGVL